MKGPGGGYFLAKNPAEITIIEIVTAVDEPIKMTKCDGKQGGCSIKGTKCVTHHLWNGLSKQIFQYLSNITLADLYNQSEVKTNGR